MLVTKHDALKEQVAALVAKYGSERGALLPILQDLQRENGCVSPLAMQVVAAHLEMHPVEVNSVVTFYAFLSVEPVGKYVIRLCRTLSCDMAGKQRVARQLENDLGIRFGETTKDGRFTLEWANCMGMCEQGPAMLVNDKVFTRVQPDQVHDILAACRRSALGSVHSSNGHRATEGHAV